VPAPAEPFIKISENENGVFALDPSHQLHCFGKKKATSCSPFGITTELFMKNIRESKWRLCPHIHCFQTFLKNIKQ
jgi:hypothetical protein